MANRYWVGGTDTWNATAGTKWATTSGGSGGASVPTSSDDVYFDSSSGSVTITASSVSMGNLDTTGFTGTINGSSTPSIYGSLTIGTTTNLIGTNWTLVFRGNGVSQTITTNGVTIPASIALGVYSASPPTMAGYTLTDNIKLTKNFTVYGSVSYFNSGGFSIDATAVNLYHTSVDISGSTINLYEYLTASSQLLLSSTLTSLDVTGATFNMLSTTGHTGICYINGWAIEKLNLTSAGGDFRIDSPATSTGTISEINLSATNPLTLQFADNLVLSVNDFNVNGSVGNLVTLSAITSGTQFTLNKSTGIVSLDYITVVNSTATGGATWIAGLNSSGVGTNTGWTFMHNFKYLYFDGHDGISDPDGVWFSTANAFNDNTTNFAYHQAMSADGSNNYLKGQGTNATLLDGEIEKVSFRAYASDNGASPHWSDYVELTAPTGGWTFQKVKDLEVRFWTSSINYDIMADIYTDGEAELLDSLVIYDNTLSSYFRVHGTMIEVSYYPSLPASTSLTGDATITANPTTNMQVSANITGDATIAPLATTTQPTGASMSGDATLLAVPRVQVPSEALDKKTFLYKVYDKDGNFITEWRDVISEFTLSQEVNNGGSTINIELARTAETMHVSDEPLATTEGDIITTEGGIELSSFGSSNQPFGEGTDVDLNHRVEIYMFYGYTDYLNTQDGDTIDDQDDFAISVNIGSPNGRKMFTGFISAYNARYGSKSTTTVTLNSFGDQLQNYLIEEAGDVTVPYYSKDPADMLRSIIDKAHAQGLEANYDERSIVDTKTISTYKFNLNTYSDGIKKILELAPADWYWYYDMAQNLVWLRGRPSTPSHTFILGKHIKLLDIKKDTDTITNTVYFTGGEIAPDVTLFNKYQDGASVSTNGQQLKLISDSRVTRLDTAEILGQGEINRNANPNYIATCEVLTSVYPIEDIRLGELVAFRNFGNFIDKTELQILRIDYDIDKVRLQLGSLLPSIGKRIADIKRNLDDEQAKGAEGTPA